LLADEELKIEKHEKNMKIYLDNCCFNRPFDDQSSMRVKLEAEAKLFIQEQIIIGNLQLKKLTGSKELVVINPVTFILILEEA
jgi:hypothetical protein